MLGKVMLYITFGIICMVTTIIDIQKQKIYNETVAVLLVPAIVSFFVFPELGIISRLLGAISVSGIMLLMCLCLPGVFGGGDIKFMVPVGLMLGVERAMLAGMLAVFLAGAWSIGMVIRNFLKNSTEVQGMKFPFGPMLCIGSFIALAAGDWMV